MDKNNDDKINEFESIESLYDNDTEEVLEEIPSEKRYSYEKNQQSVQQSSTKNFRTNSKNENQENSKGLNQKSNHPSNIRKANDDNFTSHRGNNNLNSTPNRNRLEKNKQLTKDAINKVNSKITKEGTKLAKKAKKAEKAAKVAKTAKKSAKVAKGGKIVSKILSSKILLIILAVMILLVLAIVLLVVIATSVINVGSVGNSATGYYDSDCNFNETVINLNSNNIQLTIDIDEYVKGTTYSYIKDGDYSDRTIKALMVILKTNALSLGNYNKSQKTLTLNDSSIEYTQIENISYTDLNKLNDIYGLIEEEIYLSSSYSGTISNLSSANKLSIDSTTLDKIENMPSNMSYSQVLDELYSTDDKKIYKLSENCTFYNITENDAYWWPIGSKEVTQSPNIYGGTPSTTYISSDYNVDRGTYNHGGVDIAANCNENIVIATKSGTITAVNDSCDNNGFYGSDCGGGFGNYVYVDHGNGIESIYAHLYPNSVSVEEGQTVTQGQKLGTMGNSGSSTGCHLHFEMRVNGSKVNPHDYVDAENSRPRNNYILAATDDNPTTASETKKAICNSLLSSGYSKNAVAGILVNMQAEGGFLLNNLEDCYEIGSCCYDGTYGYCMHPEIGNFGTDEAYTAGIDSGAYSKNNFINDSAGYGLIQWTYWNRKEGLYDYAKKENKSIASVSVQLGYLLEEVKGYSITYKYITGNYTAYDIANNFCLNFENPANAEVNCPARAQSNTSAMLAYVENGCS